MIPFQERKKLRKIIYSKASLAMLFVVFIAVSKGSWDIYQKAVLARTELGIAERSFEDLKLRTTELQASLVRLKSEQGIEAEVRQKYTVVRQGEEVVVVVDDSLKKGENNEVGDKKSLWQWFVSFFE